MVANECPDAALEMDDARRSSNPRDPRNLRANARTGRHVSYSDRPDVTGPASEEDWNAWVPIAVGDRAGCCVFAGGLLVIRGCRTVGRVIVDTDRRTNADQCNLADRGLPCRIGRDRVQCACSHWPGHHLVHEQSRQQREG